MGVSSTYVASSSQIAAAVIAAVGTRQAIIPVINDNTTAGTWVNVPTAGTMFGFFLYNSSGAQNDEMSFNCALYPGTYTVVSIVTTTNTSGIATLKIGANEVGSFDCYSAGDVAKVSKSVASIVVTSTESTIGYKMKTKNGSSSQYQLRLEYLYITKTA